MARDFLLKVTALRHSDAIAITIPRTGYGLLGPANNLEVKGALVLNPGRVPYEKLIFPFISGEDVEKSGTYEIRPERYNPFWQKYMEISCAWQCIESGSIH